MRSEAVGILYVKCAVSRENVGGLAGLPIRPGMPRVIRKSHNDSDCPQEHHFVFVRTLSPIKAILKEDAREKTSCCRMEHSMSSVGVSNLITVHWSAS
jgi:hypothetical protein